MTRRIFSVLLAAALCLPLAFSPAFAGAPLKTYTEVPTGVKATTVSMMDNGFGSFKTLDDNGNLISKGVIAPNGNVPVFREAKADDPADPKYTHYAGSGKYIADLQPVLLSSDDGSRKGKDFLIFTDDGATVYYLSELIQTIDRLQTGAIVDPRAVYFGNDGCLTAIAAVNSDGVFAYIIDFKDLSLKVKFQIAEASAAAAPGFNVTSLNEGLIVFSNPQGAAGWMDLGGNRKVSIDTNTYKDWWNFSSGRAMVLSRSSGKYGYFDTAGKLAIPCIYRDASMFKDGYAYVSNDDGRYGYIDADGKIAIPFHYNTAYGYGSGLFAVGYAGQYAYKYGLVDKNDNEVVPVTYDDITRAYEDHAYAIKNGEIVALFFTDDPEAAKDVTNVFTDVPDNAWYAKYLQNAYDNRIVGGTSADKYTPDGSLTHAQIMVMVANLHSLQKGDNYDFQANKKAGDAWYQVFEDYCIAEGIIPAETFTDPGLFKGQENASVNRGQMAFYFAHALTEDAYLDKKAAALSDIGGHVFAADIEKLAKANIVGGYEDGTFRPAALVTRAEASVFVSNILDAIE